MKRQLVVVLVALSQALVACGGSIEEPTPPGPPVDSQGYCPVCPGTTTSQEQRAERTRPVWNSAQGQYICPPCGYCGDYLCEASEQNWCAADCGGGSGGYCGDGYCHSSGGESVSNCSADCSKS